MTVSSSTGVLTGLMVGMGLGLFGSMGWTAALVLGVLAGFLMAGLIGWMVDGGPRARHGSDWAPPPRPIPAEAARPVAADDLRAIRGVGAKAEQALIAAGVTRFAQIAAWDDGQIDRIAARIGRGAARIRSDDWVGQAAALDDRRGGC